MGNSLCICVARVHRAECSRHTCVQQPRLAASVWRFQKQVSRCTRSGEEDRLRALLMWVVFVRSSKQSAWWRASCCLDDAGGLEEGTRHPPPLHTCPVNYPRRGKRNK